MSVIEADTVPTMQSEQGLHAGLALKGVGKVFGQTRVLDNISLSIKPGEVVALLGENGAGKSTISNIISGVIKPSEGTMQWKGKDHAPQNPSEGLDSGIRLIHQEIKLLPELSIAENIFIGRQIIKSGRVDRTEMRRLAQVQLDRLGLNVSPDTLVKELQVASQQQVEIAKALAHKAELLILDEPTAALGGGEVDRLFEQIERLKAQGVAFIYISHRMDEIARVADRIAVIRDGSLISVHDNGNVPVPQLVAEMVGRSVDRMFPPKSTNFGEEILKVDNLTGANGKFKDISFSVAQGEVFGVAGIVGAGRTELVRAIFGADAISSGEIYIEGNYKNITSPRNAINSGIVLVPEDRKQQGLVVEHTIGDNVMYGNFDMVNSNGWAFRKDCEDFSNDTIKKMRTKGLIDQSASALSGGNQQKVLMGKWIARNPKVLIVDEPTRGIDVGARASIYEVISDLAKMGMAVIVVSSDLDEILGLSNRVMVLAHGENQGILSADEANQISVMKLATQ